MNRVSTLLAVAILLVAVTTVGVLAVPGAVSGPTAGEAPPTPGHAEVIEVTFAASSVTGGTATLAVDTHLAHGGGDIDNVTVVHRATDTETGLIEAKSELDVGDLEGESATDAVDADPDARAVHSDLRDGMTENVVPGELDLPRENDYEIETIVYADEVRVETVGQTLEGVGSLTPTYAETAVDFHHFGSAYGHDSLTLPPLQFYWSVGATIDQWVDPAYEPMVRAAFNLAVVLTAVAGITLLIREVE